MFHTFAFFVLCRWDVVKRLSWAMRAPVLRRRRQVSLVVATYGLQENILIELTDVHLEEGVRAVVPRGHVTHDIQQRRPRAPGVVEIGQGVGQPGTQVQQHAAGSAQTFTPTLALAFPSSS